MNDNIKLQTCNLSANYGPKKVLHNVSINIPANTVTALIGPSGCGKSTLLRCFNRMNELVKKTRITGNVFYEGKHLYEETTDPVEVRKNIGMVFQKANPFPLSIFENVAYGLRLHEKNGKYLQEVVQESLEKADLWDEVKDRLHTSAFRLSGGQQQRLCIARAIAVKPKILLLDEPCSALDPIATAKIESLLHKLKKEMTLIMVTHNMHQARRCSERTAFLLQGKLIEESATQEMFEKPKNPLTLQYIKGEFG